MKSKLKKNNIKVIVRSRPLLQFENQPAWQVSLNKIQCMNTKSVRKKLDKTGRRNEVEIEQKFKEISFQYEKVFQQSFTSQKIYKIEAKQMVQQALNNNKNLTLMCYGQTCSGKTFTILGQQKFPGLMPCVLRDISIFKKQNPSSQVRMSYFQIYNESIYDLLQGGRKDLSSRLKIIEDKKYGCEVSGLRKQNVQNFQDCIGIIQKGQKNRAYASKQNHDRSSRSHTIMRIYIQKQDKIFNRKYQIFNIVDLAGSQRLSQFSKDPQQTASINKSLFQLSNVISKLSANDSNQHIPYRDSKLTKLLQCSLNGESNCLIVFCISPAVQCFQQTLSTLRLAKKAKLIEVQTKQLNLSSNWSLLQKQLFETKQKLLQKTVECQQLTTRLDFLSMQLERLQQLFEQMQSKCSANVNLLILLDHQNFKIQQNNQLAVSQFIDLTKFNQKLQIQIDQYKSQFHDSLQQLYEQYTSDITHTYLKHLQLSKNMQRQDFLIKIQEICFIDMVFDQNLKNICREQSLNRVLKDLQNSLNKKNQSKSANTIVNKGVNKDNKQTRQFIKLIQQYKTFLKPSQQSIQKISNNYQDASKIINQSQSKVNKYKQVQSQIYQSSIKYNQSSSSIVLLSQQKQIIQGKTLYSWGCSKDGRVFKGENVLTGINLMNKQIYGEIVQIQTSYNHSFILNKEGKVFGWGKNNFNQISQKHTPSHSIPREISIKQNIKRVATGWGHSLVLSQNGTLYSWGYGQNGQLGHGNLQNITKPTIIHTQTKLTQIYAGHSHSAFMSQKGQVYTFGFNKDYRCLIKQKEQNILVPTKILIKNAKMVSFGISHSAILTQTGNIFCGGIGTYGQFGKQLTEDITGCQFIAVQNKKWLDSQEKFEKVCPLIELQFQAQQNQLIINVQCAQNSTYFLTNFANLYFCGKSLNKKLDSNIYSPKLLLSNISSFSVGSRHGFAFSITKDKVYGWGFNMYNQLGNNKQKDLLVPEVISTLSSLNLITIECGFIHSIALAK